VACGTAGAPRKAQAPGPRAQAPPVTETRRRLAGFITGRRSSYLVVGFWLLLVPATGPLRIFKGSEPTLLYASAAVVIVLLLVTYRSPVLWLLPVLSAGAALTAAEAVIRLLTRHANLTAGGQSAGILVVLVIGTCTDYALLLISRYGEELRQHADPHMAMAVALRRAGPAIVASALTVVAGVVCLLAVQPDDITGLAPVAATGIAASLIAMVTLLPALLLVCGRRIFWLTTAWITGAVLVRITGGASGGQAH
jgi:uncharacterized membrane protein YdfJ with MMPL/SSD domain